ncbi:UNVERIFIED_CONTAM: hypothetical protein RMT77_008766 [Armadillidium vulgare]
MIKVSITFFLLFVYFSNLSKAVKISRKKCEKMGGKYCPGPKVKACYFSLKEEVFSFQEAVDSCAKKGAVVPHMNFPDYSNFLTCTGFSWDFPFGLFLQNPLPAQEKCIAVTVLNVNEYSTLSRCSMKSKMKVFCEIRF